MSQLYASSMGTMFIGLRSSGFLLRWFRINVSYSLNSFKGDIQGTIQVCMIGCIKGDTRSFDYASCRVWAFYVQLGA